MLTFQEVQIKDYIRQKSTYKVDRAGPWGKMDGRWIKALKFLHLCKRNTVGRRPLSKVGSVEEGVGTRAGLSWKITQILPSGKSNGTSPVESPESFRPSWYYIWKSMIAIYRGKKF